MACVAIAYIFMAYIVMAYIVMASQKSIKGFWTPPKSAYTSKLAEVKELEAQLSQLQVA